MKKQIVRSIKVDDETWAKLEELSKASGKSMSAYIRSLINGVKPKELPTEEWFKIYTELSEVANAFYKLSEVAQKEKSADYEKFKEIVSYIHELRRNMFTETINPKG